MSDGQPRRDRGDRDRGDQERRRSDRPGDRHGDHRGGGGRGDKRGDNQRNKMRRDRDGNGGGGGARNRREKSPEWRPTIMAKPQAERGNPEFPSLQQSAAATAQKKLPPSAATSSPGTGSQEEDKSATSLVRADSPASSSASMTSRLNRPQSQQPRRPEQGEGETAPPEQNHPLKLLDNSLSERFSDTLRQCLSENADFLVVGVVGPQSTGKSSMLNAISNLDAKKLPLFKTQTFELQMLGEHCSNGVTAYVCPDARLILVDSQPIMSASVLDRNMAFEKKSQGMQPEFGSSENTAEIQSLQLMGFLMSVCHVLLLVQDWFVDAHVAKSVLTAEMLRPTSPAYAAVGADGEEQIVEYFPELVFVHNKAELEDFTAKRVVEMQDFYETVFKSSQLHTRSGINLSVAMPALSADLSSLNLFLVPDQEAEESKGSSFRSSLSYEDFSRNLRRAVLSAQRRPISTTKGMTERSWLTFANKSWESIKNSSLYQEYSRLM